MAEGRCPPDLRFLSGGQSPPLCPPPDPTLNGRPQHLIEAAKRGRLDHMISFLAPLTTRAPPGRPAGRLSAAASKKKSFDRGGPVWPPRSNVTNDRLRGDPSLDVGLPPPSSPHCDPTTKTKENLTSFSILISTSILMDFDLHVGRFFWIQNRCFRQVLAA